MKKLAIILVIIMLASFTVACDNASPVDTVPDEDQDASIFPIGSDDEYVHFTIAGSVEYWNAGRQGMKEACEALGVKYSQSSIEGVDVNEAVAVLEALVERGVSGIFTVGHFPDAYAPVINRAYELGIPFVITTLDVPDSMRISFLGADFVSYGRVMGAEAAKAAGGVGKVIISTNLDNGGQTAMDVVTGITLELEEKWPNMEVVSILQDDSQLDVATTVISSALQVHPDAAVIIGAQSISGIAAVTAVREAGLRGSVQIVSIDRDIPTMEAIESGDIYSTVAGKQMPEGFLAVMLMHQWRNHNNMLSFDDSVSGVLSTPDFVDFGAFVINQDNVQNFIGFGYTG